MNRLMVIGGYYDQSQWTFVSDVMHNMALMIVLCLLLLFQAHVTINANSSKAQPQ